MLLPDEEDESESSALTVEPPDVLSESSPEGASLLLSLSLPLLLLLLLLEVPQFGAQSHYQQWGYTSA